jgi:hypothetical protein
VAESIRQYVHGQYALAYAVVVCTARMPWHTPLWFVVRDTGVQWGVSITCTQLATMLNCAYRWASTNSFTVMPAAATSAAMPGTVYA